MTEDKNESSSSMEPAEVTTERRGFLMKSAVLLTALGVAGTTTRVEAQAAKTAEGKAQGEALQAVLDEAKKSGDIKKALAEKGQSLPDSAKETLSKLTPADLERMKSLDTKLVSLRKELAADNNGGNGM